MGQMDIKGKLQHHVTQLFEEMSWILSLLASASSLPLSQEETPSWVNICSSEYLFSETKTTWNDAYGECELYGGHLAQIDGLPENFCLLDYAHTAGLAASWYWHSSNDIESEGVWKQYDGGLISWSPWWIDNNPAGGKTKNCGDVHLAEDEFAGRWGSATCSDAHYYICERGF